ncbi:MAG TPA: SHOCT domain-containing protein [Trebonia sp.]
MFPRRGGFVRRRPLLRTAVVGGGAYMAGKAAARRSAEQADQEAGQDARISDLEQSGQQPAPPVPEPRAAAPADSSGDSSVFGQLNQLVQMHDRGALTDEEFSAAKTRLLG